MERISSADDQHGDHLPALTDISQKENQSPTVIQLTEPPSTENETPNNSVGLITIQSSPESAKSNKENLGKKLETKDQLAVIASLRKLVCNLKQKSLRDISIAKQITRRDVVDKMSANHKVVLNNERKSNIKLIKETRELYEKRLNDVENFYIEKITMLEENRTVAFDSILEAKNTLDDQMKKSSENLTSLINIISKYPSNVSNSLKPSPPHKTLEISNDETEEDKPKLVLENEKLSSKVAQLEIELYEQNLRTTCLENKIKNEITSKGQVQQKLAYTEILYRTTLKDKEEIIKNLQDDYTNLNNCKVEMEKRHKEQFLKYDRLLKKSQAEVAVQQREVLALRNQFVPGTPTKISSIRRTPNTMIEKSTPSKCKIVSSISDSAKTVKSNASTSSVIPLSLSITSNGPRSPSVKAISESSTSNSHADCLCFEDSDEPKPKNARVLRSRRKRAVKAKKTY